MNEEPFKLLGIDLSSALGWAVFDIADGRDYLRAVGLKKTANEAKKRGILTSFDDMRRGRELVQELLAVVRKHGVGGIIAEIPGGSQSARAANVLGMAKGILCTLPHVLDLQIEYLTPSDVKHVVGGKRSVSKEDVWKFVQARHPYFDDWPRASTGRLLSVNGSLEHVADACACVAAAVEMKLNVVLNLNRKDCFL